MKTHSLFFALTILIAAQACTVMKRQHRSGYYIEFKKSYKRGLDKENPYQEPIDETVLTTVSTYNELEYTVDQISSINRQEPKTDQTIRDSEPAEKPSHHVFNSNDSKEAPTEASVNAKSGKPKEALKPAELSELAGTAFVMSIIGTLLIVPTALTIVNGPFLLLLATIVLFVSLCLAVRAIRRSKNADGTSIDYKFKKLAKVALIISICALVLLYASSLTLLMDDFIAFGIH